MAEKLPDDVGQQLIAMAETDQAMRNRVMQGEQWDASIDKTNTESLKALIQKYGWPTISKVGIEGSQSAWLIAQHADHDVEFQAECLELMKKEDSAELNPKHLAYLEDRVRVNQGRPQLYGTQFFGTGDELQPRAIEDEENLDERRAEVGLGSFEDYRKQIEEIDRTSKH